VGDISSKTSAGHQGVRSWKEAGDFIQDAHHASEGQISAERNLHRFQKRGEKKSSVITNGMELFHLCLEDKSLGKVRQSWEYSRREEPPATKICINLHWVQLFSPKIGHSHQQNPSPVF